MGPGSAIFINLSRVTPTVGGGSRGQKHPQNPLTVVTEYCVGTKKTGKGRRKIGRKKRRMRSKIRHRKG